VAIRKVSGLQPSYYPLEYPMPFTPENESEWKKELKSAVIFFRLGISFKKMRRHKIASSLKILLGVRRGVSGGVEDGSRPPALRAGHP
jgi:hypothetical protein